MSSETIEKTVIRIEADVKRALDEINKVKSEIGGLDDETAKTSAGTGKSSARMAAAWSGVAVAVAAATAAVTAFGAYSTKAASDVEQYLVSLGVLYKSQEQAGEQMQWIFDFARSTPFEVGGLVDASIKLKAFGLEAQDVLEVLGDTAAATSKPIDQVVNAYGRLSVGDTGQAIAMFRDIGVNLKNIDDLQFNAQGALVTPLEQTMPLVKKYLQDEFGGLMVAQSQTAKGIGSNIKDSMYQAGLAVMGFERETASFREGSLFVGMKEGLQGTLDFLNRINFDEIGKDIEAAFQTVINILGDYKRGLEGVDLSGFVNALKLAAAGVVALGVAIDKTNLYEHVGKAIKFTIEAVNEFANTVTDTYVKAINYVIEVYNQLVPTMQTLGMELDYIKKVSLDQSLSRYLNSTDDAAKKAKQGVDDLVDSVRAMSEASSGSKIPGWAGQSDYIRTRLKEIGGRNIDDMLAAGGMPSSIGGSQTVGGIMQANVSASVNAPMVSLVDINRTGFNTLAMKLDNVVAAVNNIQIQVGGGSFGKSAPKSPEQLTEDEFKTQALKNPMYNFSASRYWP
jgi:hypothetical protein